ncbi:MAG: NAD(P)/FAD-dependent oxidoreductase [Methanosarcinales archaeon]|nr:NAD(P)/FAD-dependent oxidoreductase [ANME-2 cluster archaeon]MDW7774978.1 NAD(P)/FAD-dependent oxidoreductase [Methanosarcinales archaeon]
MNGTYDVIIVGAGPAGMFAAHELPGRDLSICIIEQGQDISTRTCDMAMISRCTHCEPCAIMCGVGGAGTFSDGTLNLRPDIGGDLSEFTHDRDAAWALVDEVDRIFLHYGAPEALNRPDNSEIECLKRRAASAGARFVDIPQRHIGSDRTPELIKKMKDHLVGEGIHFMLETTVTDLVVNEGQCTGVVLKDGSTVEAKTVLLAPGRVGASWVDEMVKRHSIRARYAGIDIGVRVEVPAIIMEPVTAINRDPKFHIMSRKYDDFVRTFCTNHHGFVVKEEYEGFIATNGHSMKDARSDNTNFAFLVRIELTHPIENTTRYGRSVAKLATTIGGGKPVLQRMGDLRRGRRSTTERIRRNPVTNTLKDVTPGDISMAMPHRIVMDIIEGLEVLNQIIPGVASDSTLLYAPEIKFYAMRLEVDPQMMTSIKGLYAAGDGAGLSRDIVNAAATGILAARGITNNQ